MKQDDGLKKYILIAEDEPALLDTMKAIIKKLDGEFEVNTVNSGIQALKFINKSDIDLLITDIFMPGKDGLELIREVRKKSSSIKILAISGFGNHYLKVAESFGASCSLNKPFSKNELESAIHRVLR